MDLGQPNVQLKFSEVLVDVLQITKLGLFLKYIVYRIRYLLNMSAVDGCLSTGRSGKRSWNRIVMPFLKLISIFPYVAILLAY